MPRTLLMGCLAACFVTIIAESGLAQNANNQNTQINPTYQRRLAGPQAYGRSFYRRPLVFQQPAAQGFTFQRPYPYHLDYYRQRYNGGYQPYLGNLYGPPQIVGTQPFAFSGYPQNNPGLNQQPATNHPPQATPASVPCPHCQQPVPLPYPATPTP